MNNAWRLGSVGRAMTVALLVCLAGVVGPPAGAVGTGVFAPHPTVPSFGAGSSIDVALGDLDGDNDLDVVVANDHFDAETVWLNDGTGMFTAHATAAAFGTGDSIDVAPPPRRGQRPGPVVANKGREAETVWLNDGTGVFTAHPTTPAFGGGSNSTAVALGDLDGDDDLDAVVANYYGEAETVWLNDGTGVFMARPTTPPLAAAGGALPWRSATSTVTTTSTRWWQMTSPSPRRCG